MMGREKVGVLGVARDALEVLGGQIRIARIERGWTQKHLGSVCGASERTISMIERGHPSVAIGNVLNAAVSVGVPLFQLDDPEELARIRHRGEERIALIPKRVAAQQEVPLELRDF
ncbi:transcriptional regulator with XRE-family HTH domain [Leucobacter exalbidus]|uniref:Transcriptional regulator with XRE-family HTH domain n=1 Tax=Leucobacter exalbidus TaxID=662960 RepID=A0A940PU80_9MICO|nr:transcriptional regulator with XRE-family HTH domain [Leucobacter exalbidus]